MNTYYNIWRIDKSKLDEDYVIMFGNKEHGWACNIDELPDLWAKAIRCSQNKYYGDVQLMYRGKLIRSLNNGNIPILDKTAKYKCEYNKYV